MLQRPAISPINVVWPPVDREVKKKWAGICRMGGVGDNLVAASVLAPLKRAGYMTEVIAQAPHHVMFENNPFMDRLIVKQKEDFPGDGGLQWQQWFDTRGREYDLFANLSHTMEHLVAFFPGQTAFYWPAPFRRKMADHSYIELVHDMFGAAQSVISWVIANFPASGGFLQAYTLNADGSRTPRSFSTAQTAGLQTALTSFVATIT